MRIYLDMCALQRPLDDRSQLRIYIEAECVLGILKLTEMGEAELVSSEAHDFENRRNPHPDRREHAAAILAIASTTVPVSELVQARAQAYGTRGIKPLDALHLASAVEGGADFFCTCDDKLMKRARDVDTLGTRVVSPQQLITEIDP